MHMFKIPEFNDHTIDAVLEGIIHDSSREERIMMLFGILDSLLKTAWLSCVNEDNVKKRECVHAAIDVVNFLKKNLGVSKDLLFNAAYKRFYTAIHRKIIDAHKNGTNEEFQTIRASVAKLTSPPFSKAFFSNLMHESAIDDGEIMRYLLSPISKNALLSAGVHPVQHSIN
jgi:flagellin-specific chaperone FliS